MKKHFHPEKKTEHQIATFIRDRAWKNDYESIFHAALLEIQYIPSYAVKSVDSYQWVDVFRITMITTARIRKMGKVQYLQMFIC